jgi:uncharacterized membrane protein YbhN (UPF0104 family)
VKPHRLLRIASGLILVGILVWYVDLKAVTTRISQLDVGLVGIATALILLSTLIAAFNAHLLVNPESGVTFPAFLPLYWLSWAVGLVFPGQVGDIATLSTVMRRHDVTVTRTLGRSLADKLISLIFMLLFASWGVVNLQGWNFADRWPIFLGVFAFMVVVGWQYSYFGRLLSHWSPRAAEFYRNTLVEIIVSVQLYPYRVAMNAFLTCFKIGLAGSCYWFMFRALGYSDLGLLYVISLTSLSSIIAYLPISFNGLGTVELVGIYIFSTIGIDKSGVLSGYLTLRSLVLVLAWLPVLIWFLSRRKSNS